MVFKQCAVPTCNNNTLNAPKKLFLGIPKNSERRNKWERAINAKHALLTDGKQAICEDHFILSEDCENWMFFKTVGSTLKLKPDVLPHRNIHGPIDKSLPAQFSMDARQEKMRVLAKLASLPKSTETQPVGHNHQELYSEPEIPIPLTSNFIFEEESPSSSNAFFLSNEEISFKKITVQSIGVQTNMKKRFRSIQTNTTNKTRTVSTMTDDLLTFSAEPQKKKKRRL